MYCLLNKIVYGPTNLFVDVTKLNVLVICTILGKCYNLQGKLISRRNTFLYFRVKIPIYDNAKTDRSDHVLSDCNRNFPCQAITFVTLIPHNGIGELVCFRSYVCVIILLFNIFPLCISICYMNIYHLYTNVICIHT